MFNKGKETQPPRPTTAQPETPLTQSKRAMTKSSQAPSILSHDIKITGDIRSEGEVIVSGEIDGDIQARTLTIEDKASVKGEVRATEEVEIKGRVLGSVRGKKVRLAQTARIEGDIIHSSLSVESGAFFEGNCRHAADPLSSDGGGGTSVSKPTTASTGSSSSSAPTFGGAATATTTS